MNDRDINQNDYEKYSDGLNYSYLLFGGGSFISFLVAQYFNLKVLSFLSVTIFWASIYFLPHYNEMINKAKFDKITEEHKKNLIIRGVGICYIAILTICYFVPDYKFYEKNELLFIIFYTIIVILMLADSVMKVPQKIMSLKYKPDFKTKTVLTVILVAIQFFLLLYPTFDYMKIKSTYSLPQIKVPDNISVKEIDLTKELKNSLTVNNKQLPTYIAQTISNKSSKEISFFKSFRINQEQQSKEYYEVGFSYDKNSKDRDGVYAYSLIIFKDEPIVKVSLQSYEEATGEKLKYWDNSSEYKYKIRIELSDEEYKQLLDFVANCSK